MTREQVELVLKQHKVFSVISTGQATYKEHLCLLVTELLALAPQPSREALERLWDLHDHQYATAKKWREAMLDAVMGWATGQAKRRWCSHITWHQAGEDGYWRYKELIENGDGFFNSLRMYEVWEQCPVASCRTPRPREA